MSATLDVFPYIISLDTLAKESALLSLFCFCVCSLRLLGEVVAVMNRRRRRSLINRNVIVRTVSYE
jgi:hypothetical protein